MVVVGSASEYVIAVGAADDEVGVVTEVVHRQVVRALQAQGEVEVVEHAVVVLVGDEPGVARAQGVEQVGHAVAAAHQHDAQLRIDVDLAAEEELVVEFQGVAAHHAGTLEVGQGVEGGEGRAGVEAGEELEFVVAGATCEAVLARFTHDQVIAGAAIEHVVAGAGEDFVVAVFAEDLVIALSAEEVVIAHAAIEDVVAIIAVEGVVAFAAIDDVIAVTARHRGVVPGAAVENVVAGATGQQVAVGFAIEDVIPSTASEAVDARSAVEGVVSGAAIDDVVAAIAVDDVDATEGKDGVGVVGAIDHIAAFSTGDDECGGAEVAANEVVDAVQLYREVGCVEDAVVVGVGEQQGVGGADGVENFGKTVIAEAQVATHRGHTVAGALEDQAVGEAGEPQDVTADVACALEVGDAVLAEGAGLVTGFHRPEVAVGAVAPGEDIGAKPAGEGVVAAAAEKCVVARVAGEVVVIVASINGVIAAGAKQEVVAALSVDKVVVFRAECEVVSRSARESSHGSFLP
ncbi:hypothetical protein D9M69_298540 [compost metagenome]